MVILGMWRSGLASLNRSLPAQAMGMANIASNGHRRPSLAAAISSPSCSVTVIVIAGSSLAGSAPDSGVKASW
jgi:hypothetical protein